MDPSSFRLGYCSLGNESAFPQRITNEVRSQGLSAVKSLMIPLIEVPGFISSFDDINRVVKLLTQNHVVGIVVHVCTWIEAGISLRLLRELSNKRIILWSFGTNVELLPLTALIEITSSATKLGIEFQYLIGSPDQQSFLEELKCHLTVMNAVDSLQNAKIALVGYSSPGMVDVTPDEIAMRRCTGSELIHLDLSEVLAEYHRCDERQANGIAETLTNTCGRCEVRSEEILASVKLYLSLKSLVGRYDLSAVTIRCWPELKANLLGLNGTPCFALSQLSNEGIIGVCEADLSSTITMLLLSNVAKAIPVVLDFNTVDLVENTLSFWHCGAHATGLADGMEEVSLRHPSEGGMKEVDTGMALEFTLPAGKATFAKVSREYEKILITNAELVKPRIPFRGGIAQAVWKKKVIDLLSLVVDRGFEHHICAVYGECASELKLAAKMLKLDIVYFPND